MTPTTQTSAKEQPRRRADAERSVAAILEAALDALASDPEASMAEIARQAGVVRATIYVHFPTREALMRAVTERAIADVVAAISQVEPDQGEPADALRRVLAAAWQALGRFHALVMINASLPPAELHERHKPVMALLAPLVQRGQRDGTFRSGVPMSWHLATLLAVVHAASAEVQAGRLAPADAEAVVTDTVLAAVGSSPNGP